MWDKIEWDLVSMTGNFVFVYLSYLSTKTHRHICKRMRNIIRTLVAEEIYYGITFSRAKQYKTIHDESAIKHLFPVKNLIERL